ncbi:MAG: chorismate mutase [Firmicutes bacterium HGW-Firmicutes-15]|nr:MAG: chorismate mutase [Firmicutes bacterium HGW-Firmicutes-15]
MVVRGIRGAITVKEDKATEIFEATAEVLKEIIKQNELNLQDIASIIFTTTADIKSAFPAEAARSMGLHLVPLLCSQEIEVQGSIPLCIRILFHVNTNRRQEEICHVFLRDAARLREDLKKVNVVE